MTAATAATLAGLGSAAAAVGLAATGLVRARDVFGRIHHGGPANALAPLALAAALVAGLGVASAITVRAGCVAFLLATTGPIVGHATARAARLRARQTLDVRPDDGGPAR